MAAEKTLTPQVKKLIADLRKKVESNPFEENLVLVGQSGSIDDDAITYSRTFVNSGLLNPKKVKKFLKKVHYIGDVFSGLGKPSLWMKIGDKTDVYEVSKSFRDDDIKIEAFAIEKEDPTLYISFEPRQDFTLFYSLFDKEEGYNRTWDDRLRGTNEIIRFERDESASSIRIARNYILDYLAVRKKALLIGSFLLIVCPAEGKVADGFREEIKYESEDVKANIIVVKDNINGEKITARLDMVKPFFPPAERTLGDFGLLAGPPKVVLKTSQGQVDMQSYASGHDVGEFLSIVFFHSSVLKKYEDDSRYRIDDDGGVHYRGVWGVFRGIWRLGDEVIAAHLGDIAEGLPYDEWSHWAACNIDPLSTEENKKLQKIRPIPKLVNDLFYAIQRFNLQQTVFISSRGLTSLGAIIRRVENKEETCVQVLKKTFTKNTAKEEFLDRTVDLYKLVVDNLSNKLLQKVIDSYDPKYKLDEQDQPFGSLKLFLVYLTLKMIESNCTEFGFKDKIDERVMGYYDLLTKPALSGEDSLLSEMRKEVGELEKAFSVLFTLYAFRSKSGGAHPSSKEEFTKALVSLGFSKNETNYLPVYREIIIKISELLSNL